MQKTIQNLNESALQQQTEQNQSFNQLQNMFQDVCERMEEKETLHRKLSLDMANLRADCARLGESADRWQGKYEDLLVSTDRTCQDMVRLHGGTLAVVDATHQASLASEMSKCNALEEALSREVAAKTALLDQSEIDRRMLQEEILDKTRDMSKLTRVLDQRMEEMEGLQGRVKMLEDVMEREDEAHRSARKEWDNHLAREKSEAVSAQLQHTSTCSSIRREWEEERVQWETERSKLIADVKANEGKMVARMVAERAVAVVLLETTNATLQRRCHEMHDKHQLIQANLDVTTTTANTTIATLTQDLLDTSLRLETAISTHTAAMATVETSLKQVQEERNRLEEVLHATAIRVVGQEKETESLTAKLLASEALLMEQRVAWANERDKVPYPF